MNKILIDKPKVLLLTNYPFFATLLLKMNTVISDKIRDGVENPTAATDGVTLWINPVFWENLSLNERIGVLAHEVLHPAFLHHTRRGQRHQLKWNWACDYAINPILKKAGLILPKEHLDEPRFHGMSAEQIYDILDKEYPTIPKDNNCPDGSGTGVVLDFPGQDGNGDKKTVMEEEHKKIQDLIQANEVFKRYNKQGSGFKDIERIIGEFLEPKVDWRDHLLNLVSEHTKDDFTWKQPNRRHLGRGFYLPTLDGETYGDIAFIVDTSGSIGQKQLDVFSGEINGIDSITKSSKVVIYCDTKVAHVENFDEFDDLELKPHGGGGTDFRPPFKYIDNHGLEPKMIIYFTDGYCDSFPKHEPDCPVIWALYDGKTKEGFHPPFGDVLEIPKGDLN